jgi:hypothetical protein
MDSVEELYGLTGLTQRINDLPDEFDGIDDDDDSIADQMGEFVEMALPDLAHYGTQNPNWLAFLEDFPSAVQYRNRVNHFLAYHMIQENHGSDAAALEESLIGCQ